MAETFRSLRTNLLFMLGDPDKKVILVTSTTSGEGKTFIASNLAVSLALLGKKVVIVGLDIRKPGLNKVFHISHKERGITQYLVAPQSTDLRSMIQSSDLSANLNILPGGTIPPNPTELLARKSLDDAIELLKKDYDYIVLDTAPIGMVTDTQLIARVADISVYVCRADYTHKNDYQLHQRVVRQQAFARSVHRYQRTGHEKEEVRLLLRLRQVRQVLRLWQEIRLWLRVRLWRYFRFEIRYSPHKPGELLHAMLSLFPGLFFVCLLVCCGSRALLPGILFNPTERKKQCRIRIT